MPDATEIEKQAGPAANAKLIKEVSDSDLDVRVESELPPGEQWITGIRLWLAMTAISTGCFLMLLDVAIVVTAVPRITSEFHSLPDVGWYAGAYQLSAACVQPLAGKLYASFSSKWTFLTFFAIFELGSLLCGTAVSSTMLIVARAVAGLGTAGIQNGGLTILASLVPMHKRPLMMGILLGVSQLGVMIGPLIGGAFAEYNWRWCFYINLPIGGIVAALIVFVHIPDQVAKPPFRKSVVKSLHTLDLAGFVLFAGWAIQLLLALQWGGTTYPWNSSRVVGLFCGAGANFIIWVVYNYHRGDKALIPFSMLRQRVIWSSFLTTLCVMSVMICNAYFFSIYFQTALGASPLMSGVYFLPTVLVQLLAAIVSGPLMGKLGYYLPWALAGAALICIGNGVSSLFSPLTTTGQWVGYQLIIGAGRGFIIQVPYIATQNNLPPSQLSMANSLLTFGQSLGGAMFVPIGNTIFDNSLKARLPVRAPAVDPDAVIAAGATAFRDIVSPADLPGVLLAFSDSIDRVFYLTTGLAAATFVFAWGMGWHDIRKKKAVPKPVGEA